VAPDDPAVSASEVQIPAADTNLIGYLARPASESVVPVILVCHENRGLTPHIQDVTRRFAKAGYVGLAVDLLSREGGSSSVGEGNVPGVLGNIAPDQFVEDFKSGWRYLQGQSFADAERAGMTGFCFGGGVTWRVATQMPELLAAVPFYGPHPPVEDVPNIQAAVLAIYGELDARINSGIPEIEQAMQENNKIYEKMVYPDADHAFHNDTGSRYNAEAAKDAWERTLAWFEQYVRNA
jgi:carboxymethylenebutenolidase